MTFCYSTQTEQIFEYWLVLLILYGYPEDVSLSDLNGDIFVSVEDRLI